MSQFFWESTQKARKEHFCDRCCNWIQPGEIYSRRVWVPGAGSFHVMNEHVSPECPPNVGEEILREQEAAERIALGVPMVLAAEVRDVLRIGRNGETVVNSETHFVTKPAVEAAAEDSESDEEDVCIDF